MNLVVLEDGTRVGLLAGSADRGVLFSCDREYLSSNDARPLSLSLPLRPEEFPSFFTGLLPDGNLKRKISEFLHVAESSTLKLLDILGVECAGSVSLINEDAYSSLAVDPKDSSFESRYRRIEESELSAMVDRIIDVRFSSVCAW
ncbi:MAG: HipA N-terminal domain-containing protein [Sphaerochaeta sp.]|nr:HipA N-terminal domain-containing protein [Sphaerochaeta sp.]